MNGLDCCGEQDYGITVVLVRAHFNSLFSALLRHVLWGIWCRVKDAQSCCCRFFLLAVSCLLLPVGWLYQTTGAVTVLVPGVWGPKLHSELICKLRKTEHPPGAFVPPSKDHDTDFLCLMCGEGRSPTAPAFNNTIGAQNAARCSKLLNKHKPATLPILRGSREIKREADSCAEECKRVEGGDLTKCCRMLFLSAFSHGTYSKGSTEVTKPRTKPILGRLSLSAAGFCRSAPATSLTQQRFHYVQFILNSLQETDK